MFVKSYPHKGSNINTDTFILQGDSSKTSACLSAPARRMAQLAVGIIYSSLVDKRIETGTVYAAALFLINDMF